MKTEEYNQIQNLRKQLHESKKVTNINEATDNNTVKQINEQLIEAGCGTKQINS